MILKIKIWKKYNNFIISNSVKIHIFLSIINYNHVILKIMKIIRKWIYRLKIRINFLINIYISKIVIKIHVKKIDVNNNLSNLLCVYKKIKNLTMLKINRNICVDNRL